MIVPVICASDKTTWPICRAISIPGHCISWWVIFDKVSARHLKNAPRSSTDWLQGPHKGNKNIDKAWLNAIGTAVSQLRYLHITGPGLKWDCADGFQQQCYPLLVAWVWDHPEQVMFAQVSYGSCPMCEIPTGAPMGHSTFRPLDNSRDQHIQWELLEDDNIDALHTRSVRPIRNHLWQYPLCNVYLLLQPDEFHQLLLG